MYWCMFKDKLCQNNHTSIYFSVIISEILSILEGVQLSVCGCVCAEIMTRVSVWTITHHTV